MRNYLYIPLGGNRVSQIRMYFNLWTVFILSGLWHGASWNFILWGAWHGMFLVLERHLRLHEEGSGRRLLRIGLTFVLVVFGWVVFRVENLSTASGYILAMLGSGGGSHSVDVSPDAWVAMIVAIFFSFLCVTRLGEQLKCWAYEDAVHSQFGQFSMVLSSIVLFTLSLSSLASAEFNPFIYFRF